MTINLNDTPSNFGEFLDSKFHPIDLKKLSEIVPVGILWLDCNGNILKGNKTFFNWIDQKVEDLLGENILCLLEENESRAEIFSAIQNSKEVENIRLKFSRKNKNTIHIKFNLSLYIENGQTQFIAFFENITHHYKTQESLLNKNNTLKLINDIGGKISEKLELKDLLKFIIISTTEISKADLGAIYYNLPVSEKLTLFYSCIPSKDLKDTIKLNREINIDSLKKTVSNRASSLKKCPNLGLVTNKDFPFQLLIPIRSRTNDLLGTMVFGFEKEFNNDFLTILEGISKWASIAVENSRMFEQVCLEEENLRSLTESLPQLIWTADCKGNLDFFNHQWEHYTGVSLNKINGQDWFKFIYPKDIKGILKSWTNSIKNKEVFEGEYRIKKHDNSYRWHLIRAIPIKNHLQEIYKWVGTSIDINDQKKEDERKDDFISIVSHELKTPLTSLKAYTQLLHQSILNDSPEALLNYSSKSNTYIDKLNNLISDLLDLSRFQTGKFVLNFEQFELDHLLSECLTSFSHTIKSHKFIKQTASPIWLKGDKQRIEQVIYNYLTNAVKYSPDADIVELKYSIEGNSVIIRVRDYGIGIPNEQINKIFDRFYRIEHCKKVQGLGIGLYISNEIIKLHGGKTWATSERGIGTDFYIELPLFKNE